MKKLMAMLMVLMMTWGAAGALADTKITVSGTGEVRVAADTAMISLGVNARNRDVLKAQQQANETIAAIRKALGEQGIPEEDIHTDFLNIYAMYDYQNDQEQVSAYNANSTLAIRVTDMEKVGALIDVCFAAGANTLNGITFSASDTEEAKTQAMQLAVESAREKAEILAGASGLKIREIEEIIENGVQSYENTMGNVYAKAVASAEMEEDAGTVVQSAKLVVSATVSMTFEAE